MADSLGKKATTRKKVRFNEKVQVFIIQAENRKSTILRNLPSDWIPFPNTKPLSDKLNEPLNQSFGAGHLPSRQCSTSEDLINSYLQRNVKQPFTYWDVIKTYSSFTPTAPIGREGLTTPAKRGSFPSTSFPHLRGFSPLNHRITTPSFPRRTTDKNSQFSEILAIYGNNPSLRNDKKHQPEPLAGNLKKAQVKVDTISGAFHDEFRKTAQERGVTSSTAIFPYFKRPEGLTQRALKSTSYFF